EDASELLAPPERQAHADAGKETNPQAANKRDRTGKGVFGNDLQTHEIRSLSSRTREDRQPGDGLDHISRRGEQNLCAVGNTGKHESSTPPKACEDQDDKEPGGAAGQDQRKVL